MTNLAAILLAPIMVITARVRMCRRRAVMTQWWAAFRPKESP